MIKNQILLENVSFDELVRLISNEFKSQLEDFKQSFNNQKPDELLTRAETCEFLKIDSSTLWAWTNKGKVIAYGIANRRYYKKSELMNCLIPLKKIRL